MVSIRADQRGYKLDRRRFRNRLSFDIGVMPCYAQRIASHAVMIFVTEAVALKWTDTQCWISAMFATALLTKKSQNAGLALAITTITTITTKQKEHDMLTLKEASARDGAFSARYLQKLCRTGRIKDAICHGGTWFLTDDYTIIESTAVKGRPRKVRLEPRTP